MLPSSWIDALFARLGVRYGAAFARQWPDADMEAVKADWGHVLARFNNHPEAIRYALENLSDLPPNAMQFREIARRGWVENTPMLPEPEADPERMAAAIESLRKPRETPDRINPAQQCIENIERLCNGKPSPAQRHMVSHCLRISGTHTKLNVKVAE